LILLTGPWYSTEPSRCEIPGPKSQRKKKDKRSIQTACTFKTGGIVVRDIHKIIKNYCSIAKRWECRFIFLWMSPLLLPLEVENRLRKDESFGKLVKKLEKDLSKQAKKQYFITIA
jgi:hypothetical protein